MQIITKIFSKLSYPGQFFRYKTYFWRKLYYFFSKNLHFFSSFFRRNPKKIYPILGANVIKLEEGYLSFMPEGELKHSVDEAFVEIDLLIKNKLNQQIQVDKKNYLIKILEPSEILPESKIYKFLKNEQILKTISKYLDCFPILTYVSVWYSPAGAKIEEDGSQMYHLDHEDFKQVKLFLNIEDVDLNSGPFTMINAKNSLIIQKKLRYKMSYENKRVPDSTIFTYVPKKNEVSLIGPKGLISLVDTSSCFHYGSRGGTKNRIVLTAQYITPYAFIMPWFWWRKIFMPQLRNKKIDSKIESMLLGEI